MNTFLVILGALLGYAILTALVARVFNGVADRLGAERVDDRNFASFFLFWPWALSMVPVAFLAFYSWEALLRLAGIKEPK